MSSTVVPPSDEVSCFFSPPPKRFPIPSAVFWRLTLSLMLVGEDCFVNQSAGDGAAVKALVSKDNSEAVSSTTTENSDGPVMIKVSGCKWKWGVLVPRRSRTLSCLCLGVGTRTTS